jgi:hypothetical protein
MRRCSHCFHYSRGRPSYCPYCGRTYNVRLCPRGHANARNAQFCADCGSDDLSTPAPSDTWLSAISHWVFVGFVITVACILALTVVASVIGSIDWSQLAGPLVSLVLMGGLLHWSITMLPGPIKKIGKATGKKTWNIVRGHDRHHGGHH